MNLQRSAIVAPVSGYVAKRQVQLGQRVQPGATLMTVVPLEQVWVEANFKETQLGKMRIGQPVEVHSDLYGGDVEYNGKVAALGLGTGSAFSLLPAQNASGNWIKIVQRVPVRIELDPKQLVEHPLRLGLSMSVDVGHPRPERQLACHRAQGREAGAHHRRLQEAAGRCRCADHRHHRAEPARRGPPLIPPWPLSQMKKSVPACR